MADISIWKGGRKIADASDIMTFPFDAPPAKLYYFQRIEMAPPVLFEHLAGTALVQFLDECSMLIKFSGEEPQSVDGLRYIHGRSEVMKGTPSISAVLLAAFETPVSRLELLPLQPRIYEKFLQIYNTERDELR